MELCDGGENFMTSWPNGRYQNSSKFTHARPCTDDCLSDFLYLNVRCCNQQACGTKYYRYFRCFGSFTDTLHGSRHHNRTQSSIFPPCTNTPAVLPNWLKQKHFHPVWERDAVLPLDLMTFPIRSVTKQMEYASGITTSFFTWIGHLYFPCCLLSWTSNKEPVSLWHAGK